MVLAEDERSRGRSRLHDRGPGLKAGMYVRVSSEKVKVWVRKD